MPVMSPFEGAKSENDEQQRNLLDVIAQSGAAGRKEYENAQAQAQQQKQNALDYAAQRARITGTDFGPTITQPVGEAADRYNTYFAGQNAAFQNNLQGIGNSAQSYLAKVNAIAPFVQAQNVQQASDRENQLKMAIAANQAKIDADKAAALQAHNWDLEKMALAHNYDQQDASARASAASKVSLDELLGAASQTLPGGGSGGLVTSTGQKVIGGPRMHIGPETGANVSQIAPQTVNTLTDEAARIGQIIGVPATTLAGLYAPGKQSTLQNSLQNLSPSQQRNEVDKTVSSLSDKYAKQGVTPELARSVINNVDFRRDVEQILSGAGGRSREEVDDALRKYYTQDRNWYSEYVILKGEYLPLLPTAAELANRGA